MDLSPNFLNILRKYIAFDYLYCIKSPFCFDCHSGLDPESGDFFVCEKILLDNIIFFYYRYTTF
jgi:hypothetical protein